MLTTNNHTHEDELSPAQLDFLHEVSEQGLDVKLTLLQHHAHLAELLAREIMEDEVVGLAGERYSRDTLHAGRYVRWGTNPGSVEIDGERVPLRVPRVRDTNAGREQPLRSYQQMKRSVAIDSKLEEAILLGLSQRDYERVASAFAEGFGLSQSTVSRRFQERSCKALEEFEQRSLEEHDIIALVIDGKYLAAHQMVICLGVTIEGRKIPLGFVETTTENAEAIKGLLKDLLHRGLDFSEGLLCIIDGAKGLRKAVREVFGEFALVQRCQWHKRENVVSYLNESDKDRYRCKLQRAYELPTYDEARAALIELHAELQGLNRSAARSLMEGLDETLTLHRLGLFEELGRSLKTTNTIENVNGQLGKYIGRVKHWMHSDQRQRWVALALLEVEQRMHRIAGYEALPQLRKALREHIEQQPHTAESEPLAEPNFN